MPSTPAPSPTPLPSELNAWLKNVGFSLQESAVTTLCGYLTLLMQWNRVMNLVGAHTWQDACKTLLIDSLYLARFLEDLHLAERFPDTSLVSWDLGAGAGLPGIPLRTIWQQGRYCMVESREKRALFLSTVLARYPLPRVDVFKGRVEQFMAGPPARYAQVIVSRAFMPWPALLQLVRPHLSPQGLVILLLRSPLTTDADLPWRILHQNGYTAGHVNRTLTALTPLC